MDDGKQILARIAEQYDFYYDLMKCRQDKRHLKEFYETVRELLKQVEE